MFSNAHVAASRWFRQCLTWLVVVAALTACASPGTSREETAEVLDKVLAGEHRSPEDRARDVHRHPKETLLFFGIRPEMHVVEIWPAQGWYTEVIAPLLNERGKYYAAQLPPNPESKYITDILDNYRAKVSARPDLYRSVEITAFGATSADIAPPGSVDMVVSFRNIHNWMGRGWAPQAFDAMYKALKPGGVLGVVEHRGDASKPQDPQARSGYVNEDYAIRMIEEAGFKLVAKSEINANPRDTKDYEQGVWTLPPNYRLGDKDREKYAAIGESDRFTLKFEKPKQVGTN
jgi:predicted methyltransferase